MVRTTPTAVEAILLDNFLGSATGLLTPFIFTASVLVDAVSVCATARGVALSSDQLERIEALLAAHFYGHADQFYTQKQTQSASGSFQGRFDLGLNGSQYGQSAMLMDTSRCLASMNSGGRITFTWLGKVFRDSIDYVNR